MRALIFFAFVVIFAASLCEYLLRLMLLLLFLSSTQICTYKNNCRNLALLCCAQVTCLHRYFTSCSWETANNINIILLFSLSLVRLRFVRNMKIFFAQHKQRTQTNAIQHFILDMRNIITRKFSVARNCSRYKMSESSNTKLQCTS